MIDSKASHHLTGDGLRVLTVKSIAGEGVTLEDDQQKEYTFSRGLLSTEIKAGERVIVIVESEAEARKHQNILAKEILNELLTDESS